MKNLSFLMLFLLIIGCSAVKTSDKTSFYYEDGSLMGEVYDDSYMHYKKDNTIDKCEVISKNKKQIRLLCMIYDNNKLLAKTQKVLDIEKNKSILDGEALEYHAGGSIKSKTVWENNKIVGKTYWFYEKTGRIAWEVPYKNGKKHGIAKQYTKEGTLYREETYKNDKFIKCKTTVTAPNGTYMECIYFDINKKDHCKTYYKDGTMFAKNTYDKQTGKLLYKEFYKNGRSAKVVNEED